MKYFRYGLFVLALMVVMSDKIPAEEKADTPTYQAVRTEIPPRIDGKLDDEVWQKVPRVTGFTLVIYGQGSYATEQTLAQISWDEEKLYLVFTCLESNIKDVRTQVKERDGPVAGDDCIEIFIDADHDHKTYLQFVANSAAVQYDGEEFDEKWNGRWEAAGVVGANAWFLEVSLPFSTIGVKPHEGDVWGFNMNREHFAGNKKELGCWSNTEGGFHAPQKFGHLAFGSSQLTGREKVIRGEKELNQKYLSWLEDEIRKLNESFSRERQEVGELIKTGRDIEEYTAKFKVVYDEYKIVEQKLSLQPLPIEVLIECHQEISELLSRHKKLKDDLKFHILLEE